MKPSINADGTLTVEGGSFTTAQVERLIHDLALARNDMQPGVPVQLPTGDALLVTMNDPHLIVSRNLGNDITVGFRHTGFGWCVAFLTERSATFLRNALDKRLATGATPDKAPGETPDASKH